MKKSLSKKSIIIYSVFLLVMILFFLLYNFNSYKIKKVENIILSDKSTIEELDKSLIDLKKYEAEFNCSNKDSGKNKYYNFCSTVSNYFDYGKAKIMYKRLDESYNYNEYKEMYNYLFSLGTLENNSAVSNMKNEISNIVYNFFINKIVNNESEKVNKILEELSGKETAETGESGGYYCTSYLDDDMANIYNFSLAQIDTENRYFYYRNNINYKSDKEYMTLIINYLIEELEGYENPFNKYPNQSNEVEGIRAELLEKSFSPRSTRYECKKLESDYNLSNSAPEIGMTKQEVLKSAWGSPKKINKTTTKYGTREQWMYSSYKYLYFDEDGLVVSIQE